MMLCGRAVKAGGLIPFEDKGVDGWQVKLRNSSLTRAIPAHFSDESDS